MAAPARVRQQHDVDGQRRSRGGGDGARGEGGRGSAAALRQAAARITSSGDFTPNFSIGLSRKDVSLALAMAARLEMPVPLASTVRQVYEAAHAQGFGQLDMAGVTLLYEQWTGVAVRGAAARDDA